MRIAASIISIILATSAAAEDLSITIYNDGRALVEDKRDITFPQGRKRIELPNVSSQIMPETVSFTADGVAIVEQNFDFDLLSPQKLMEKAVGQTVRLVRTNPATGAETTQRAKVLAVNSGVVVQIGERIEVLRDDGLPTRVIFDRVPPNLRARPTLSIETETASGGAREATLTYLSRGFNWKTDYVALFDESAKKMDLQGWATLTNSTDTSIENAKTQLVAGNVNARGNRPQTSIRSAGIESGTVERIGDNYLYSLPGRTTIASKQTKQVAIVDAETIDADKAYEYFARGYQTQREPQNVDVRVAFSNAATAGLGEPLPSGVVRVYSKDSEGRAQFIGEDSIGHTPAGSDISLKIGEAFDVTTQSTIKAQNNINRRTTDTSMDYVIRNARPEAATVTIRQFVDGWRTNHEIRSESHEHRRPDANSFVWEVTAPPGGETTLSFTLRSTRRF